MISTRPPPETASAGGELLEHPYGVVGADDARATAEFDLLRCRRRGRDHRTRGRCGHVEGVVLAHAEVIQPVLVGQDDRLVEVADGLRGGPEASVGVAWGVAEAVGAQFHDVLLIAVLWLLNAGVQARAGSRSAARIDRSCVAEWLPLKISVPGWKARPDSSGPASTGS